MAAYSLIYPPQPNGPRMLPNSTGGPGGLPRTSGAQRFLAGRTWVKFTRLVCFLHLFFTYVKFAVTCKSTEPSGFCCLLDFYPKIRPFSR